MLTLVSALTQWRHRRRGRSLSSRQRGLARHRVPPGLDTEQFLSLARMSFLRLQTAWDAGDLAELQRLTTGPLLAELREQIEARGGGINRTEVIDLQARLLAAAPLSWEEGLCAWRRATLTALMLTGSALPAAPEGTRIARVDVVIRLHDER